MTRPTTLAGALAHRVHTDRLTTSPHALRRRREGELSRLPIAREAAPSWGREMVAMLIVAAVFVGMLAL